MGLANLIYFLGIISLPFVKGVYVSTETSRDSLKIASLVEFIDTTELNSVVLDIQDDGVLIWERNPRISSLISHLHEKNIYVIGRIVVWKNTLYVRKNPYSAIKNINEGLWEDGSGSYWIDPAYQPYWDDFLKIVKRAVEIGFDEINLDYIRFPTGKNLKNIYYPYSKEKGKGEILKEFFKFFRDAIDSINFERKLNIPISIDIFGIACFREEGDGTGQRLKDIAEFFDWIMPMPYPSHYSRGWFGFENPAEHPYEVVYKTLISAKKILDTLENSRARLRPWLQDFHMGAYYDEKKIRAQKQAVYDAKVEGWVLWNINNRYTKKALDKNRAQNALFLLFLNLN